MDCIWIAENFSFVLTTELGRNILTNCFLFSFKYSYAGDSDFELSVKGISVGIEDLQVMCPYPFNKFLLLNPIFPLIAHFCSIGLALDCPFCNNKVVVLMWSSK